MKDKPKKMTMAQFGPWLQEKTGAGFLKMNDRTECVVSIDHIEPGCFAALYVMTSLEGLVVFELVNRYKSKAAAWQALGNDAETYPSVIFEDWVLQQYLTDRNATVEKLAL